MTLSQRVQALVLRALAALPPAIKRRLVGPPVRKDGLELDLDAQLMCWLNQHNLRPPVEQRTPEQARADLREASALLTGHPPAMAEIRELKLAGGDGDLDARLYVPFEAYPGPAPLLVYFHGGGWVIGDIDTHDAPCRFLAHASGARVLSVDYRLAPEHPYPAGVDDAVAAFRDTVARAQELGAEAARIAVGGDSAGGHLCALVAQRTARDGGPAPAYQVLIYPATDFLEDRPSVFLFAEGFLLTKANMDWYESHFLPDRAHAEEASPLRTENLEGLAPALVVTGGFDPLRDEGEAYATRLAEAGVPTILRRHPGQVHGFFNMVGIGRVHRDAVIEIGAMVRAGLAPAPTGAEVAAAAAS